MLLPRDQAKQLGWVPAFERLMTPGPGNGVVTWALAVGMTAADAAGPGAAFVASVAKAQTYFDRA
jgi:hypothetical protein